MGADREHVTLLIDRKRNAIYRVFVGRPDTHDYRAIANGWTDLKSLANYLISPLSVPPALAPRKIEELELSGGPASFDYTRSAPASSAPVRPGEPGS